MIGLDLMGLNRSGSVFFCEVGANKEADFQKGISFSKIMKYWHQSFLREYSDSLNLLVEVLVCFPLKL